LDGRHLQISQNFRAFFVIINKLVTGLDNGAREGPARSKKLIIYNREQWEKINELNHRTGKCEGGGRQDKKSE
jgi:hypothetical protein